MSDELSVNARVLLRAAYEFHVEQAGASAFPAGTALDLRGAAERIGVRASGPRHDAAVAQLVHQGAVRVSGTQYLVTARGRELLGL